MSRCIVVFDLPIHRFADALTAMEQLGGTFLRGTYAVVSKRAEIEAEAAKWGGRVSWRESDDDPRAIQLTADMIPEQLQELRSALTAENGEEVRP